MLAPWFPPHLQRNIYLSLLHLEPEEGKEKARAVPDSVLRAALLRRAVEDIKRIIQVRTTKQACSTLLQRGSVGDDLWQRFLRAEKEMEEELRDVVMEVRTLFHLLVRQLTCQRQMHLPQTGAKLSFNLLTRLPRILLCGIGSTRFKRRCRQKKTGGKRDERLSRRIL